MDKRYCAGQPRIFAVGDIVGLPALASASMEQGRLAGLHANGHEAPPLPKIFHFGIYAIPEISMVAPTET